MKMFVWPEFSSVSYTPGLAVAVANSKEEAIALLVAEGVGDMLQADLQGQEPEVYDLPHAAWCWGGD